MGAMASQITSLTIVYAAVYSGADQSKNQSSASLAFVWGIHRGPVNSPHKWPVTRKMFPFDDVIMIRHRRSMSRRMWHILTKSANASKAVHKGDCHFRAHIKYITHTTVCILCPKYKTFLIHRQQCTTGHNRYLFYILSFLSSAFQMKYLFSHCFWCKKCYAMYSFKFVGSCTPKKRAALKA